ncbi:hypothetical protein D3C79_954130 [compost metagenome]
MQRKLGTHHQRGCIAQIELIDGCFLLRLGGRAQHKDTGRIGCILIKALGTAQCFGQAHPITANGQSGCLVDLTHHKYLLGIVARHIEHVAITHQLVMGEIPILQQILHGELELLALTGQHHMMPVSR